MLLCLIGTQRVEQNVCIARRGALNRTLLEGDEMNLIE